MPKTVDILIICALKEEYDALVLVDREIASPWEEIVNETGRYVSRAAFFTTQQDNLKIIATWSHRMGGEAISATASHLLSTYTASCLAMSGICAGRRDKVKLGDVIFADRMWTYDTGKFIRHESTSELQGDFIMYSPDDIIVQRMQKIAGDIPSLDISSSFKDIAVPPEPFNVHVGPLSSGSQVREDSELFPSIVSYQRKVLGIEMEASNLAALGKAHKLPVIVVKSVCDFADEDKDDTYHMFADRISAECLIYFLRHAADLIVPQEKIAPKDMASSGGACPLALIEILAEQYPDAQSTRSVWERAGGKKSEVDNIANPRDLWQKLWGFSVQGARVTPSALLMAVKEDLPNNTKVQEYLKKYQ